MANFERNFIPVVIGFAPLVLFLLTWDVPRMGIVGHVLRDYTFPVLGAELVTILVALREGMVKTWKAWTASPVALGALLILLATAIGTAAFVSPNFAAVTRTACWIIHLLFGLSVAFLCGRTFSAADLTLGYLAGFVALMIAFAIFAAGALQRPINWQWDLPAFSHNRHPGIYATPMIALSIGIMATARVQGAWLGAFLVAVAGFALVLWTGSRGPLVAIAAAIVVGLLFVPAARSPRAWGGALASLAIAYFLVKALPVPAEHMGAARTITATQGPDVLTGRDQLWRVVWQAIEQRPIFGYSDGQMKAVAPFYGLAQPHNLVLQILLAWGIVGLLACLTLGLWFAKRAIPAVRDDKAMLLGPFLAIAALGALSMVDAALYHILPVSIFAACCGMIAAHWHRSARE